MGERLIDKFVCDTDYGDGGVYLYETYLEWLRRGSDQGFKLEYRNIADVSVVDTRKKTIIIKTKAENTWKLYLYKDEEIMRILNKQMRICKEKEENLRAQQQAAAAAAAANQFANQGQYYNGPSVDPTDVIRLRVRIENLESRLAALDVGSNSADVRKMQNKIEELENKVIDLTTIIKQLQKQINYLAGEVETVQKRLPVNIGGNEQIPSVKQVDDLREKIGHLEWRVLTLERK